MANRYRDWCVTLNNPEEGRAESILDGVRALGDAVKWFIMQGEIGENGTEHLQAFICFSNARTATSLTRATGLFRGAHVERRAGSALQATEYCEKDDTYAPAVCERISIGERPIQVEGPGKYHVVSLDLT